MEVLFMGKYEIVVEYDRVVYVDEEIEAEDIDMAIEIATSEYNTRTIITVNGKDIEFSDAKKLKIKITSNDGECVNIDYIKGDDRCMMPLKSNY